ncbi:MAG: pyruvate formate lyase family protein [Spirochaetales bacterium]|uniref:Pyruvate formate lyase family protein n=1 Tax=Candidatus Thalassospirochaeta sargassi TaxID=3119039 RepID=A0AAJ1ILT9_9SPIO|nr:pyruvate formate lyase family protein [Spirochaetales bacterium]
MNERINSLREKALNCAHEQYRIRKYMSILTDENRNLPVIERKALGFIKMLEQMPKFILEGELIVGARTLFAPRPGENTEGGLSAESRLSKNLDFSPDAETLAVENPGFEFYPSYLTEEEKARGAKVGIAEGYVTSHCAAGFANILSKGFNGLKKEAQTSLAGFEPETENAAFLRSVLMIIDAIQVFIEEYAALAESEALKCKEERRAELEHTAVVCRNIKEKPAADFQEALQLTWFTHLFMLMENYNLMSLGRPDQYLYSFYKSDIESGKLNPERALELLSCFFIKLNDGSDLHTDNGLNIIISGLKPDGTDGTNELSWLFIETYEQVKLVDPQINIRWHKNTHPDFMRRAMQIRGHHPMPPMIFNDEVLIPGLNEMGVEIEDARDYCIDACQDVLIGGKSDFYPIFGGTYGIHLLKIFERVIPSLPEHNSFDSFYKTLLDELRSDVAITADETNRVDSMLPQISPTPVLSMTLEGCIKNGIDKTAGGTKYNFTGFIGGGLVNIVDSLAAIKKHVFDEKNVSAKTLTKALKANYEGYDELRLMLKNKSPKWGNADKIVDDYGVEIARIFGEEVAKQKNSRGGRFIPGLMTHHQVRLGKVVGATPDGRAQGEALAVSLSPSIGQMKKGPTCALSSAMTINHKILPVGTSVDLTLQNSFLQSEADLDKVITMTEVFLEGGGLEVQYNVMDPETLRAAQAQPEKYRDLVVRVWGFNAYFVTLQKEYQDELIARAETGAR